jgi:peptidoglycan hydrolase-like protein with peptidoglycan-binding domain
MIKQHYLQELSIAHTCGRGLHSNAADVKKVQSWLTLYAMRKPDAGTATAIDGIFGPATERAVRNYQAGNGLPLTGVVDQALFRHMSRPLADAFGFAATGSTLREKIIGTAKAHLQASPFELAIGGQTNSGPWVRSYMDGNEGSEWLWCMGFVQSVIAQAAAQEGKDLRSLMPLTYLCDVLAQYARDKRRLISGSDILKNPSLVIPGDIFLLRSTGFHWYHTGVVIAVHEGVLETIEGNTNNDGSSNGNGVYRRVRGVGNGIDVVMIEG